jgi:hypothetical protein
VIVSKSIIDRRPFQSKADRERQEMLESQYRKVAIPELVAALGQPRQDKPVKTT